MKGIYHVWSRGRHFSPSLPGGRYLKLGSKSENSKSQGASFGTMLWCHVQRYCFISYKFALAHFLLDGISYQQWNLHLRLLRFPSTHHYGMLNMALSHSKVCYHLPQLNLKSQVLVCSVTPSLQPADTDSSRITQLSDSTYQKVLIEKVGVRLGQ